MKREQLRKMILAAIFIAMILLLAFTPMLGYIKIGPALSITTIGIPVIIGAIILGPYYGMLLGFAVSGSYSLDVMHSARASHYGGFSCCGSQA